MVDDKYVGLILALSSSAFIGASFIIKKKGLQKSAVDHTSAGQGGHGYLREPLWWAGLISMILGEVANFVAYGFAPAILVTPLGALSVIISAILASMILKEYLHIIGKVGCALCVVGSTIIVLHAPDEREISSLDEIWSWVVTPGFLTYLVLVIAAVATLMLYAVPRWGQTQVLVPVAICSLVGSVSVMAVKALSTGLKLTINGESQLDKPVFWVFVVVVAVSIGIQLHFLNMALFLFNTAVVSPIYYVFFTSATIIASVVLFREWSGQSAVSIVSQLCGFAVIVMGVYLLHSTHDPSTDVTGGGVKKASSMTVYTRLTTAEESDGENDGGVDGDDENDDGGGGGTKRMKKKPKRKSDADVIEMESLEASADAQGRSRSRSPPMELMPGVNDAGPSRRGRASSGR